jgi:cell division protease FtsH
MFHKSNVKLQMTRNYSPFGRKYYEEYIKKLNSRNTTLQTDTILNNDEYLKYLENKKKEPSQGYENNDEETHEEKNNQLEDEIQKIIQQTIDDIDTDTTMNEEDKKIIQKLFPPNTRIIFKRKMIVSKPDNLKKYREAFINNLDTTGGNSDDGHYYNPDGSLMRTRRNRNAGGAGTGEKSENFEVITKSPLTFDDIGGYSNIKRELAQCVDILVNYKKYANYNVRIPKGLLLEGPPGNGKTMLAKGFAGETNASFIAISGSQFQDKYVGVGASRVRELFELARRNLPCIIFIDEIDAIGRKRGTDSEASTSERDSTLNELLINLDGFKTGSGIFLMGATNRADLLDPALLRPGRIDKRIYIGHPDSTTREAILNIHLKGKPADNTINVKDLVDMTAGLSGAQIENLLNEAMLNALRENRFVMTYNDLDIIINKIMVGWQPTEHQFSSDIIDRIAIHEMGHAVMGFISKHHSKVSKVVINLSAPNTPGYTMFEQSTNNIHKREALFEHLMILLSGRIAEEIVYGVSVTTGAINDFEEAIKLAERMILYYGMGTNVIYPSNSEKYKELIDDQVSGLIQDAYTMATMILNKCCYLIIETADILKNDKIIKIEVLTEIIETKYPEIFNLKN